MRFFILMAPLLLLFTIHSSAQDFLWATSVGGIEGERSKCIALDINNNIYTVGTFRDTADFDPGPNVFNLVAKDRNDIFIQKLDTDGNFVWAIALGSAGTDDATAVSVDAAGNVYVTGSFRDTVDFDPSAATNNLIANGNTDIFVLKLDGNGTFLWVKQMGGTGLDEGNTLTTDATGNVYVAGRFIDSVDFDPNAGVLSYNAGNSSSSFIQKLDAAGNLIWVKALLGNAANEVFSIALDANNNVYTTGDFSGTIDFDPGIGIFNFTAVGGTDIFIQKLDALGNFLWAKQMGGIGLDEAHSITIAPNGAVYSLGRFNSTVDFDPGIGVVSLTSNGNDDVYIQKLTSNGDFTWARSLGGSSFDDGRSITTDAAGNVYLVGHFTGVVDFDLGAGISNLTAKGGYDAFIQKIDANANLLWVKIVGAASNDLGRGLVTDNANHVYYTGYYRDVVDFDPGMDSFFLASMGDYDAFVCKLSTCSVDTAVTWSNNVLTANAIGATYQWIDCATGNSILGATAAAFTPSNNGDYQVLVTQNGCTVASSCYNITFVGTQALGSNSFNLYPTPTTGQVTLEWETLQETAITVLDVQGKVVLPTQTITSNQTQLSLEHLPAGVYYVSMLTAHHQTTIKIIKQ